MITIATFAHQHDADFARSRLEAAGIEVYCPDESVGGFASFESPLTSGVRLQVADDDAPTALAVLKEPPIAAAE